MIRRGFVAGAGALLTAARTLPVRADFLDEPIGGSVTFGVIAPLTGDDAKLGEQMGNGVRAALNEANRLHGALDKLYQMQTFDDENLLASGLVQAGFAADNPSIVCVIGHLSGRITQAALRTYVADRMAVIVPASTYDGVTAQGYGNVIRLVTKDSSEGQLMAQYLRKKIAPKTVVPVYQDGDYGADVVAGFQQQITADKIASVPVSFSWSKPDYAAAASAVLAPKPDAVLLAGNAADIGPLAPALRAAGYNGPLFGSAGMFDPVVTHKFASSLEGLVISTSMPPLALAPSDYQILSDYGQSYGAMTPLAAFSYAAAQIAIAIVHRTGATDHLSFLRALDDTATYQTVVGTLAFTADGDPFDPVVYFYSVTNGAWKFVAPSHPTGFVL